MKAKRISDHLSYKISDHEVVKRVVNGEKELYEILVRRHNQTLYRVLRSYLGTDNDIEDLMQEVWLKAWKKLHLFRNESTFSTWLIRIGINEALGNLRKKKNNNLYLMKSDLNPEQLAGLKGPVQMNPENKTIRYETRRLLEQAIDRLPTNYRSVYMLREVEQMSTSETAISLQISESNVKVRLYRARLLLKDILMDIADGADIFEFGNRHCDNLANSVMKKIL